MQNNGRLPILSILSPHSLHSRYHAGHERKRDGNDWRADSPRIDRRINSRKVEGASRRPDTLRQISNWGIKKPSDNMSDGLTEGRH